MSLTLPMYPTNAYFNNTLAAIINPALAAPVLLSAGKMMAGTTLISPSLVTAYGDLAEASFTGYAQSATIVWGVPINDVDTTPTSQAPSHLFRCTAGGAPQVIQNWAITDGVAPPGTGILASASSAQGPTIANLGDGFSMLPSWNMGNVPGALSVAVIW